MLNIRTINVFLESLLLEYFPSLGITVDLTSLGCPPTLYWLLSGLALGAAQILIWSYSSVFLPPMSTAIRASAFSFVGKCLYSWVGRFWVFFLSHTALGFNCGFISTSTCGSPTGAAPEAVLEDLGLPLWGVEVVQLLGSQWFCQHQVLRGVGG